MADNVYKCLTMACEFWGVSFGCRYLKNSRGLTPAEDWHAKHKTRQMQRPDKDKCKDSREDRVAEDRDSEFKIQRRQSPQDDSDGSKQYANNTKTAAVVTERRGATAAIRRATIGRVAAPITAAEHAVGAGGWALWVVSTG